MADQKVWALFYWGHILRRQTQPMTLHGFDVTDPIRNYVDYGYTMCSTTSGINQSLYEALGLPHQFWDICNHTVSTVHYNGAFHMVDNSMSNLVTLDDGVTLASVEDTVADSARLVRERSLYSTSPNGFLTGSDTSRSLADFAEPHQRRDLTGFRRRFCAGGIKLRDYYYNWNWGHRYVLDLREDESYTRYYHPLGTTSDYWVGSEEIASANPAVTFQIDPPNKFGLRGNGSWTFTPTLTADAWSSAAYRSTNIAAGTSGGLAPNDPGLTAEIVYKVQAGNAITSQKIQAQFSRTAAGATATIAVSLNHGLTWQQVGDVGATVGPVVPAGANLPRSSQRRIRDAGPCSADCRPIHTRRYRADRTHDWHADASKREGIAAPQHRAAIRSISASAISRTRWRCGLTFVATCGRRMRKIRGTSPPRPVDVPRQ